MWPCWLSIMARQADWRITGDRENDSDGRVGPLHIHDSLRNIGREGIWGYGSDGMAPSDPIPLHIGT